MRKIKLWLTVMLLNTKIEKPPSMSDDMWKENKLNGTLMCFFDNNIELFKYILRTNK